MTNQLSGDRTYTPRPGSKVAAACQALLDGPMPAAQLASAMDCRLANISATLAAAVANNFIVMVVDDTDLLHYALGGMSLDEKFRPYAGESTQGPIRIPGAVFPTNPMSSKAGEPDPEAKQVIPIRRAPAARKAAQPAAEQLPPPKSETSRADGAVRPEFVAGLLSNGELLLSVDGELITLSPERTRELIHYLAKMKGQPE